MNTFKEAAIKILRKVKKPLDYKDITRLALEQGLLETKGATPERTMNSYITTDIKDNGKGSHFIKTKTAGTFALNPNRKEIKEPPKTIAKEIAEEEKIKVEGASTGKGGEHRVCSELLFRGVNASIMSVDMGIDIAVIKENRFFGIQVKTSNINKFGSYVFNIRKAAFKRHSSGNVFYVFVLRGEEESLFLILPFQVVQKKINEKVIREIQQGELYQVIIKHKDDKIYLRNKDHEVGYYRNNWELIQ